MENEQQVAIPENMRELVERKLREQQTQEREGLAYISIKGKKFRIGDAKLPDKFQCVIGEFAFERTYYSGVYDPNVAATPDCYALSFTEPEAPHIQSENKQSVTCATCPHSVFGSARIGKGTACKSARRLILFAYGANGVDFSQTAQLKVPAASLKAWGSYCAMVRRTYGLPLSFVITEISMDEDSDYPSLEFHCIGPLTDMGAVNEVGLRDASMKLAILRPFKQSEQDDKPDNTASPASDKKRSKMSQ
jgi:hypothetical protein